MTYLLILLALSFAVSAVGWIYFIYFFSIGYGLTITTLAAATAIIFHDTLTLPTAILCAVLFVGQMSPATFYLYNLANGVAVNELWAWIGAVVATIGVIIEMVADVQKSAAKKVNARRFVDTGLYRIVRGPNYFGEILMWTGSFVICFGACCTLWQWVIAIIGYIGIVYVMFSGARRLELRQTETYGNNPEFQAYIKKTPLILPFVPIYSVAKHKWLQA